MRDKFRGVRFQEGNRQENMENMEEKKGSGTVVITTEQQCVYSGMNRPGVVLPFIQFTVLLLLLQASPKVAYVLYKNPSFNK